MLTVCILAVLAPLTVHSQTTVWRTTHNGFSSGNCQLQSGSLRVTVLPFGVDVEEEAQISPTGQVWSGDASSLEIEGTFTMSKGTAVRSMLLWDGQRILKAKLRDRTQADSAYEAVVDRQKPQPAVRDPAIIQYEGNDTYRFKIYPAMINTARKIRILYTVPLQICNGKPAYLLNTAFITGAATTPGQIPVEIRKSEFFSGQCIIQYGTSRKIVQYGATYQIPQTAFWTQSYFWGSLTSKPLSLIPDSLSWNKAYCSSIASGCAEGNYTAVIASVPDTVKAMIEENGTDISLEALVNTGTKKYIADIIDREGIGIYLKTTETWDSTVQWTLYENLSGKVLFRYNQKFDPISDSFTKELLPLLWGAKYTISENLGNTGALFGFVDRQMSLLALPTDTLGAVLSKMYQNSGVPALLPEEIILKPSQIPSTPQENVLFEFGTATIMAMNGDYLDVHAILLKNGIVKLIFKTLQQGNAKIMILDLKGRIIFSKDVRISGDMMQIGIPTGLKGMYVLRIYAGSKVMQKQILLK